MFNSSGLHLLQHPNHRKTQVKSDQNLGFLVSNRLPRNQRIPKGRDFRCLFFFQEITKKIQKMGQVYVFVTKIQSIFKQKGKKTWWLIESKKWVRCWSTWYTHTHTPELWTIVTHGTTKKIRMMMSMIKRIPPLPPPFFQKKSWTSGSTAGQTFSWDRFFFGAILYNIGFGCLLSESQREKQFAGETFLT